MHPETAPERRSEANALRWRAAQPRSQALAMRAADDREPTQGRPRLRPAALDRWALDSSSSHAGRKIRRSRKDSSSPARDKASSAKKSKMQARLQSKLAQSGD